MPRHLTPVLAALLLIAVPLAPAADSPKSPAAPAGVEGVWEGWVVDGKGERTNGGRVHLRLTITADTVKGEQIGGGARGGQDMGSGTYKISEGNPMQMDATRTGGGGGGRGRRGGGTNLGIYTLEGDTLKWCVANPGRPRPTEFQSTNGPGQYLMILTRQKPAK